MPLPLAFQRAVARLALEWFYREVTVVGAHRVPRDVPLLVVANHPNMLVDALVAIHAMPRPLHFTGKATLLENPAAAAVLSLVGFVPLRRVQDELEGRRADGADATAAPAPRAASAPPALPDPSRNAEAFRRVTETLARGGAVLVFPEGVSKTASHLFPIKTGVARMAEAALAAGVRDLHLVAVGSTFEAKDRVRSDVAIHVGAPLAIDGRAPAPGPGFVAALTEQVRARLEAVTLNAPAPGLARRRVQLARVLTVAGGDDPVPSLARAALPLPDVVATTRAIAEAERALGPDDAPHVARLLEALDDFERERRHRRIALLDLRVEPSSRAAMRFALREATLVALAFPVQLVARLIHALPFRLARTLARRRREPVERAMTGIVSGAVAVLLVYAALATLAWRLGGPLPALVVVLLAPLTASLDLAMRDRQGRRRQRVRAWWTYRRDPAVRASLLARLERVAGEARRLAARSQERPG